MHRHAVEYSTLPQGPSLGSGLFCPGPSSLNRPHPPHSQAHRDFAAWRLIRDAFAVRERLGDPRVVPGFHCSFLPGMPSSPTPGSPTSIYSRTSMPTWPSPNVTGAVNPRIDGEAGAGEDKGAVEAPGLFNGIAIQSDGLSVVSSV